MTTQRWKELALTLALTSFAPAAHSPTPANHAPISHPLPAPAPVVAVWQPVQATVYYPSGQPMFSGERIPRSYRLRSRRFRYVAVSHDLMRRYGLQDTILVRGDPHDPYWDKTLDGAYIIKDLMNGRFKRRIDILSQPHHERDIGLWRAHITKYHVQLSRSEAEPVH